MTPIRRPVHSLLWTLLLAAIVVASPPADEVKGVELVYRLDPAPGTRQTPSKVIEVIRTRLKELKLESGVELILRGEGSLVVRISKKDKRHVDQIKRVIAARGKLEFRITVEKDKPAFERAWTQFENARKKKGVALDGASRITPDELNQEDKEGFPHGLRWCRLGSKADGIMKRRCARDKDGVYWMLVELDTHNVSSRDLTGLSVSRGTVRWGDFVVGFSVVKRAQDRMHALTDLTVRQDAFLAVILDGRPIMAPHLNSSLRSNGQISGGFKEDEAKQLAAVLRSAPIELAPVLVSERRGK